MSYALDAANRLHNRQVEATTQLQDLVFKAVGGLAALRNKAPQPPTRFTAPLDKVAEPVAKVVGTPREIAEYVSHARRDWTDLRTRFQDGVAHKFGQREPAPTAVSRPTIVPEATVAAQPKPKASAKATNA